MELLLDGKRVALFLDTKIGITAMNPFFNDVEAFSYPFTIPYKPNEAILKNARRIQSVTGPATYVWTAELREGAIQLLRGEAVADGDFEDGAFPIVLRSSKTSFTKQAELLKLQDLDYGSDPFDAELTAEEVLSNRTATLDSYYPTMNYVCAPFYDKDAWNDAEGKAVIPNYINQFNPETRQLDDLVVVPETTDSPSRNTWNAITYSFYVRFILKCIIELLGFTLVYDEMETIPDLSKWFLLSLNAIQPGEFFINWKGAFPRVTVREFLITLRQFGIAVLIDEKLNTASIRLINNILTTAPVNNLFDNRALKDVLVMAIPPDGYTISYNDQADDYIIQVPANYVVVATLADLPAASGTYSDYHLLYYVSSLDRYYMTVLQEKAITTDPDVYAWKDVGNCRPYISDKGESLIELGAMAVGQRLEKRTVTCTVYGVMGEPTTATWDIDLEMPEINKKMNTMNQLGSLTDPMHYAGAKYEDPPLVFLFNWGMRTYYAPDPTVFAQYPVISGDAWDCGGNEKGSISMRTSGEKSIISQLVKAEQDWLIRRKQKRQYFRLTLADYAQFKWDEIQNIGSVNYFVNSLKFDLSKNGISLVEAELFTV